MQNIIVEGTCKWAKVHKPGTDFNGDPQYSIDVYIDDFDSFKKDVIAKHKIGQKIKTDAEGKEYFQFRKKAKNFKGEELSPPVVKDSSNNNIPETTLIGNGSKVRVAFSIAPYKLKTGKEGNKILFKGIQVVDLVRFVDNSVDFDTTEGYVAVNNSDDDFAVPSEL